jgi:hypothetical protein
MLDPPPWVVCLAMADEPPTVVETAVKALLRAIPYVGSLLATIFEDLCLIWSWRTLPIKTKHH